MQVHQLGWEILLMALCLVNNLYSHTTAPHSAPHPPFGIGLPTLKVSPLFLFFFPECLEVHV